MTTLQDVLESTGKLAYRWRLTPDQTQNGLVFAWQEWKACGGVYAKGFIARRAVGHACRGRQLPGTRRRGDQGNAWTVHLWSAVEAGERIADSRDPAAIVETREWLEEMLARLTTAERVALVALARGETKAEAARIVGRSPSWMQWTLEKARRILCDLAR